MIIDRKKIVLAVFFCTVLVIVGVTHQFWADAKPYMNITVEEASKRPSEDVPIKPGLQVTGNNAGDNKSLRIQPSDILIKSPEFNSSWPVVTIIIIVAVLATISGACLIIASKFHRY
jgi:hypothetical protein